MKKKQIIHIKWLICSLFIVIAISLFVGSECSAYVMSRAENDRLCELLDQGVNPEVASDQAAEEFGHEGYCKTGGLDGKMLDGSVAPNNQLGLSATPTKPSCTHDWVEADKVEPTCQTEGKIEYACSKCNKTKTETLKKTEHDYVLTENKNGNCQEKATQTFTCSVCGDTYTVDGELGEHLYVKGEDSKEPTCTEKGLYTYTCSICADTYTEEIDALGHDYPNEKTLVKEPTCTEDGKKAYVCARCSEQTEEESIPAIGHKKSDIPVIKKDATFWKDGQEEYVCENCNEVLETVIIPAKGGVWRFIIPIVAVVVVGVLVTLIVKKKK